MRRIIISAAIVTALYVAARAYERLADGSDTAFIDRSWT